MRIRLSESEHQRGMRRKSSQDLKKIAIPGDRSGEVYEMEVGGWRLNSSSRVDGWRGRGCVN